MISKKKHGPARQLSSSGFAIACLASLALSPPLMATETRQINKDSIESQPSNNPDKSEAAREWGLSPHEWTRYQQIMQGPRGIQSPGLDPLSALGIEAQSVDDRQRFAELQVHTERQRVEKELAYQLAYDQAFARLYPDEKIIQLSSPQSSPATPRSVLKSDGRLAVFVEENCRSCIVNVQRLQKQKQAFDLYFIGGQGDDERIRRWAILAGIEPASVRSQQVTLNHDDGRWLGLRLGGKLPALVREVNGKWQRQ
jgi:integrating conjugative element protein (TIGR03759 family)